MIFFVLAVLLASLAGAAQPAANVLDGKPDANGFLVHTVQSPYQAGPTDVMVLLPERLERGKAYPVVYVLPVEAGKGSQYGNGLLEVKRHDLHNRHQAVFVAPTFSHVPWYADHPADPKNRQESHFLKIVVPLIETRYPVQANAEGRLLLGFSKSGWGAFSLLLRHPDVFGRAVAWDAPLMQDKPDSFGMAVVFSSQENFAKYRIAGLLEQRSGELRGEKRLILTGHSNFRIQDQQAHALMTNLGIPHEYRDGPMRTHDWHSGWLEEAVDLLLGDPSGNRRKPVPAGGASAAVR
jgi:S-formylglutathione hydrolase FrmB